MSKFEHPPETNWIIKCGAFFRFSVFFFFADIKRLGFLTKSPGDIFICSQTEDELIDRLQAYEPKIDPILSKLNWSDDDHGKK